MESSTRPDRLTLIAFTGMVVLGGANGVAIRLSNRGLPPFWGGGLRFALASLLFFAVVVVLRVRLPRGRDLLRTVAFGVLVVGLGFGLGYWALQRVQAGTSQIVLASVPLLTFFAALLYRQERFRWRSLVGGFLAIGGIALLFDPQAIPPGPLVAIIGAAVCLAQGIVLAKSISQVHPAAMNAVAMAVGSAILLVTSLVAGERMGTPTELESWLALGYLVVVGSLAVFALFLFVLKRWTASAAAYQFVLFPLVAVALSAWLDREPVTWELAAAGVLVIAGVYVGALMNGAGMETPAEPTPAVAGAVAEPPD